MHQPQVFLLQGRDWPSQGQPNSGIGSPLPAIIQREVASEMWSAPRNPHESLGKNGSKRLSVLCSSVGVSLAD